MSNSTNNNNINLSHSTSTRPPRPFGKSPNPFASNSLPPSFIDRPLPQPPNLQYSSFSPSTSTSSLYSPSSVPSIPSPTSRTSTSSSISSDVSFQLSSYSSQSTSSLATVFPQYSTIPSSYTNTSLTFLSCGYNASGISAFLSFLLPSKEQIYKENSIDDDDDNDEKNSNTKYLSLEDENNLILSSFLINTGDSSQRFCSEHRIKLKKIKAIFITSLSPHAISGFPGIFLALSDLVR